MSFQVLSPQPTPTSQIINQLAQGYGAGIQEKRELFQKQKQAEALGIPKELAGQDPRIIQQFMKQQEQRRLIDMLGQGQQQQAPPQMGGFQEDVQEDVVKQFSPEGREVSQEEVEKASIIDPNLGRAKAQERKLQQQEVQEVKKRNLEKFDQATESLKSAKEQRLGLKQLEQLSDKIGEKQGKEFYERFAKTFQFNPETRGFTRIGRATSTPEEERYVKLIADQTKNIKDDFGARVTNLDLSVFLSRFPDLMMTPEGRKQIFETLNDYNKAKQIYNKEMKKQIKMSKGKADPFELEESVERAIKPQMKELKQNIAERGFSKKQEFKEGATATDPKTGKKATYTSGKWVLAS